MGGGLRVIHPQWFTRYVFGFFASVSVINFAAEQQYGINRAKDPNILWGWWSQIMEQKRQGKIPMDYPGYMLANYRNDLEQTYVEKYGLEELPSAKAAEEEEAEEE